MLSSQCMFETAVQTEQALGLDLWGEACPPVEGCSFTVPDGEGGKQIEWASRLDGPARSVDQRLKVPAWMDEAVRGAERSSWTRPGSRTWSDTHVHDLVIVATGKGTLGGLFAVDREKSPYETPQRALALTYVTGMTPRPEYSAVCFNLIPEVGEYFVFPALTTTGTCEIMVFEGVPGGPMDCWDDIRTPEEHLARSRWILETFMPWEAERCREVELTDANGILTGRYAPTVRTPVARLPSGPRCWHGGRGGPERPDHRAGLEQRREVRRVSTWRASRARRRPPSTALDAADVRPLLAWLRAVGDLRGRTRSSPRLSRTSSASSTRPGVPSGSQRRSRTASTTRGRSSRGGSTPARPSG